jgi:hypothetical protein
LSVTSTTLATTNVTAYGQVKCTGTGSFGPASCSTLACSGAGTVGGAFSAASGAFTVNGVGNTVFTGSVQAPYVNVADGGLYVYSSGTNTAAITAAGALTCTSYGSYCSAPLYTTSLSANATTNMLWGAVTGSSDITHSTNGAPFVFSKAGLYVVTASYMQSSGSVNFASQLQRSTDSGANYTTKAVQSTNCSSYVNTSVVHTFPPQAVSLGDYWQISLYSSATLTLTSNCGASGGGSGGSYTCSWVQFVRIA